MLTYGDGVTNLNLKKLYKFHRRNKKLATVTAVRPPVRFGEVTIRRNNIVKKFDEKPHLNSGWINGGFFILNKEILKYIKNYKTVFEREPLIKIAKLKQLIAYKHKGYWKCMDNMKDKEQLEEIFKKKKRPYGR